MNRRKTARVIELSEQTVIDEVVARLSSRYPAISKETVESIVQDVYARFDGRPLRDYVPLLVERNAKNELEQLGGDADCSLRG